MYVESINIFLSLSGLFDGGNPTDESMEFLLENHDWMVTFVLCCCVLIVACWLLRAV